MKQSAFFFFAVLVLMALVVRCDEQEELADYDYMAPSTSDKSQTFFLENFNEDPFTSKRWIVSKDPKYNGVWKWANEPGSVIGFSGDKGLLLTTPARHYAISSTFEKPLVMGDLNSDLVVQYEVKFEKNMECGGSYIKLLHANNYKGEELNNDSPYVIMFGPDYCGATNKVHFIFRHQNPKSGVWEEKHLKDAPKMKNDQLSHVYTLIVRKDQTFEILIDQVSARSGSLLTDFDPPVNPPKEINDPEDHKPSDWVDEEFIDDPDATKPDDWDEDEPFEITDQDDVKPEDWLDDEPEMIRDPSANRPEDWDDEEDGEWEAPLIRNPKCDAGNCGEWQPRTIKNPKYKGKWSAPQIKNPAFKGVWEPRKIPNPHYFEDNTPSKFAPIGAVAIEVWTMQGNILFDNFLIAFDEEIAKSYAQATWAGKIEKQKANIPKEEEELVSTGSEFLDNFIEQAKLVYEEYPLAIVGVSIFAVLVTIPIFFICRGGNKKSKKASSTTAEKSDEPSADEQQEETANNSNEASTPRKKKKSKKEN